MVLGENTVENLSTNLKSSLFKIFLVILLYLSKWDEDVGLNDVAACLLSNVLPNVTLLKKLMLKITSKQFRLSERNSEKKFYRENGAKQSRREAVFQLLIDLNQSN